MDGRCFPEMYRAMASLLQPTRLAIKLKSTPNFFLYVMKSILQLLTLLRIEIVHVIKALPPSTKKTPNRGTRWRLSLHKEINTLTIGDSHLERKKILDFMAIFAYFSFLAQKPQSPGTSMPNDPHCSISAATLVEIAGGASKLFEASAEHRPGTEGWYTAVFHNLQDFGRDNGTMHLLKAFEVHVNLLMMFLGPKPANAFLLEDWYREIWGNQIAFWDKHLVSLPGTKDIESGNSPPDAVNAWLRNTLQDLRIILPEGLEELLNAKHPARVALCQRAAQNLVDDILRRKDTPARVLSMLAIVAIDAIENPMTPAAFATPLIDPVSGTKEVEVPAAALTVKKRLELKRAEKQAVGYPPPGAIFLSADFLARFQELTAANTPSLCTLLEMSRQYVNSSLAKGYYPRRGPQDKIHALIKKKAEGLNQLLAELEFNIEMTQGESNS